MEEKNHPGSEYYRTLRRKMVLLVIAVPLTPLILISSIILYQFHVSYHEKVLAHLEEVVLKHRQNIDSLMHNFALSDAPPHVVVFFLNPARTFHESAYGGLRPQIWASSRAYSGLIPGHTAHNHFLSGYLLVEKIY